MYINAASCSFGANWVRLTCSVIHYSLCSLWFVSSCDWDLVSLVSSCSAWSILASSRFICHTPQYKHTEKRVGRMSLSWVWLLNTNALLSSNKTLDSKKFLKRTDRQTDRSAVAIAWSNTLRCMLNRFCLTSLFLQFYNLTYGFKTAACGLKHGLHTREHWRCNEPAFRLEQVVLQPSFSASLCCYWSSTLLLVYRVSDPVWAKQYNVLGYSSLVSLFFLSKRQVYWTYSPSCYM